MTTTTCIRDPIPAVSSVVWERMAVSPLGGVLRGLARTGTEAAEGAKIADMDPRGALVDANTISDKARAVGGGVLEALLMPGARPA